MERMLNYTLFGVFVLILFACSKEIFNPDEQFNGLSENLDGSSNQSGEFRIMSDPSCSHTEIYYFTNETVDMLANTRHISTIKYITKLNDLGVFCDVSQVTLRDETNPIYDTIAKFPIADPGFTIPYGDTLDTPPPPGCLIWGDKRFDFQTLLRLNHNFFNSSFENAQKYLIVHDLSNEIYGSFMGYNDQVDPYDKYGTEKVMMGLFSYSLSQSLGSDFARLLVENAYPGLPPYNSCGQQELKNVYLHLVDAFENDLIYSPWDDGSLESVSKYIINEILAHRL